MKISTKVIAKPSPKKHRRFAFCNPRYAQINSADAYRYFVVSSEELLREHADLLGGEIAVRRSVAWVLDEDHGGLAEFVVAA